MKKGLAVLILLFWFHSPLCKNRPSLLRQS